MKNKLLLGMLTMTLILSLTPIGCSTLQSQLPNVEPISDKYPSPSSYPIDISGQVIVVTQSVILYGSRNNYATSSKGSEYWIVQTAIRNKSYHNSVSSQSSWMIGTNEPPGPGKIGGPMAVGSIEQNLQTPIVIPEGQTGEMKLCFVIQSGLNPNNYKILLLENISINGKYPLTSSGDLLDTSIKADIYDYSSQKIVKLSNPSPSIAKSKIEIPSGTYTNSVMGLAMTATFKSNKTLEMYNNMDGKRVFNYSISDDGTAISITNIVTNETSTVAFRYIKENECVVIGNVSFFK